MQGYFALVLHAHLPYVRHPEHERFLEENWLFEAITETYIPLLNVIRGWVRDEMAVRLTLTLTPTAAEYIVPIPSGVAGKTIILCRGGARTRDDVRVDAISSCP